MKPSKRLITILLSATLSATIVPYAFAQTKPDSASIVLSLPQKDQPAAVLFARLDQDQSKAAINQLQSKVPSVAGMQVVVVVSGPTAKDAPESIGAGWPVLKDADYELAGKLAVHVWPTLVALDSKGAIVGHVAGVSNTFVRDADAYLSAAAGKIDQAELKHRLASEQVVSDSPKEKAARHIELARRMMEDGKLDAARGELKQALLLQPDDASIKLLAATAALDAGASDEAIALVDTIKPGQAPQWQVNVVRLHTLVSLQRWEEAKSLLPETIKLNPDPAEAYYLAGMIYEHDQNFQAAAEAYRKACEMSRKLKAGSVMPTSAPDVK
jgi:tetratricopeptide (TPR) repeat protein